MTLTLRDLGRSLSPAETGGWFMSLLPLAAGLWLRPSWPGAGLALIGSLAFLLRQPLKQLRAGVRKQASWTLLVGGGTMILGLALGVATRGGVRAFLPAAIALPWGLAALSADLRKQARELPVELAALVFFCTFSAGIPFAGGAAPAEALRFGLLAFLSLAPGFAAVRFHLARRKALPQADGTRLAAMHGVMGTCLAAGLACRFGGWAGWGWLALQALLYARAFLPLHRGPAWHLGVLEIVAEAAGLTLAVLHV